MIAVVLGLAVTLVGCSTLSTPAQPTSPAAPTTDTNSLRTQVAQTIVAQITVDAALHPSATPEKVLPTSTQIPPTAPPPTLAPVTIATQAPTQAPKWNVQPTITKTAYTDACVVQSVSPNNPTLSANEDFDAKFSVKNTGYRAWNTQFYFKKVKGDLGPDTIIHLDRSVAQLDNYDLTLDMAAPDHSGIFVGVYKLVNDDGTAICSMSVGIKVP